jgi:nicotinate dehydrogenase subunit A
MTDTFTLQINGAARQVSASADTPLLSVLRNDLGMTGARFGCGLEQCGACMVLIDGTPSYACTTQTGDLAGRSIETVEGMTTADGALHPLQQAFLDEQAGQCGYCLSGILISAKALLDANPRPTRADIVEALDKHLCRCGAYTRILRAVERAASAMEAAR